MRTPKLTTKMTQEIGRCLRFGLDWTHIANILHVHRNTLLNWRKASETATSGVLKKLREEIEAAEAGIILKISQTVIEAATCERLTKRVEKETRDKEGNPYTEITKTYEGADISTGLKVLEKFYPRKWGPGNGQQGNDSESGHPTGDQLSLSERFLKDAERDT